MNSKQRLLTVGVLTALCLVVFQNCGKGFEGSDSLNSLSSQCVLSLKKIAQTSLPSNCDDISQYTCERRVFGKSLANRVDQDEECTLDGDCVLISTISYSTDGAADEDNFTLEYNHEEVLCAHSTKEKGIAVYTGEAATFAEALKLAKLSCQGQVNL